MHFRYAHDRYDCECHLCMTRQESFQWKLMSVLYYLENYCEITFEEKETLTREKYDELFQVIKRIPSSLYYNSVNQIKKADIDFSSLPILLYKDIDLAYTVHHINRKEVHQPVLFYFRTHIGDTVIKSRSHQHWIYSIHWSSFY